MSAIGGEIAASVRAEAFGDVALQQLAEVVVLLEGFEVSEGGRQLEEQGEAMGALGLWERWWLWGGFLSEGYFDQTLCF